MGYTNAVPDDQWTPDDLDRAEAAKDYAAINTARRDGRLHSILNPPPAEVSDADRLAAVLGEPAPVVPVGPTVPGQMPGGMPGSGPVAQMDQAELDRLTAAGDYAAINTARRSGRLSNLGVPAPRGN